MGILAKITAVILIIVGLLTMLSGVVAGVSGLFRGGMMTPGFNNPFMPALPQGFFTGISLLVGAAIFGQGLMLAAVGEALFLIANIAHNTSLTGPRPG